MPNTPEAASTGIWKKMARKSKYTETTIWLLLVIQFILSYKKKRSIWWSLVISSFIHEKGIQETIVAQSLLYLLGKLSDLCKDKKLAFKFCLICIFNNSRKLGESYCNSANLYLIRYAAAVCQHLCVAANGVHSVLMLLGTLLVWQIVPCNT